MKHTHPQPPRRFGVRSGGRVNHDGSGWLNLLQFFHEACGAGPIRQGQADENHINIFALQKSQSIDGTLHHGEGKPAAVRNVGDLVGNPENSWRHDGSSPPFFHRQKMGKVEWEFVLSAAD
jgi:hypothetical protein